MYKPHAALLVFGALLVTTPETEVSRQNPPLAELQRSLSSVLSPETALRLREGTSFLSPPGTVIFVSHTEGVRRLVALARAGEPELSMLYLPRWGAWITETTERTLHSLRLDSSYVLVSLATEDAVELWHTHNDVGEASDETHDQLTVQWTMPWIVDLLQLYEYSHDMPGPKLHCYIAHIYGVTGYWNDEPGWAEPLYLRFALRQEAQELNIGVADLKVGELPSFAARHQGFVHLQFQSMP